MLKKVTFLVALIYTIVLATVSLITLNNLPEVQISFADKIFHFLAYGIFVVLWYLALYYKFNLKKRKAIGYAFILAVTFGIIIEVLQDTMTASRALDVYDALANTLGALMAGIVLWMNKSLHVKNS
ncbi:VanZ family protein [uncultured Algibacter sp.]|uniref:VanZ family protein n=1 Tax=uncultured Algibacter sp. TaxID=298659 RepID=UPI00262352DC|nr:VanZ family protein [uncultured Algibacter sp.]